MESTKITVSAKDAGVCSEDLLVFCVAQPEKGLPVCEERVQPLLVRAIELGDFSGKANEVLVIYPDGAGAEGFAAKRIMIVGLGKSGDMADSDGMREILRGAGGTVARQCEKLKAATVALSMPATPGLDVGETAQALAEGILLGDYRFRRYKTEEKNDTPFPGLKKIVFLTAGKVARVRSGAELGARAAKAANVARDMANEPGNSWTPARFAEYAAELAEQLAMQVTVLERADMQRLGMGGILAVSKGSAEPPKMVVLEYSPEKATETVLLVGKGLTFDSGGVSLKPAAGMEEMKYDMCGGAAVLTAMRVIGEERPACKVVAIVPATENMGGSAAVKPGDVIVHYGGITSEIVNTDAEGRMILADALAYGIEQFAPCCVIDLATLTGAVIVALGHHHTGILGNNDELVDRLIRAGKSSGEPLWRLPLGPEYTKQIESPVADIKNTGGKAAGTITAAAYLQKFVKDTPWAHLDIAGTAWEFTEKSYIPKGPAGVGTRTLVSLIRNWQTFAANGK